jgi:hypothetical protein
VSIVKNLQTSNPPKIVALEYSPERTMLFDSILDSADGLNPGVLNKKREE